MEGVRSDKVYESYKEDPHAGLIPRALQHLFDKLDKSGAGEYTIRVSFLEIYNEEIFDLLSKVRPPNVVSAHPALVRCKCAQGQAYRVLERGGPCIVKGGVVVHLLCTYHAGAKQPFMLNAQTHRRAYISLSFFPLG